MTLELAVVRDWLLVFLGSVFTPVDVDAVIVQFDFFFLFLIFFLFLTLCVLLYSLHTNNNK